MMQPLARVLNGNTSDRVPIMRVAMFGSPATRERSGDVYRPLCRTGHHDRDHNLAVASR
jgi:hypothetical protein